MYCLLKFNYGIPSGLLCNGVESESNTGELALRFYDIRCWYLKLAHKSRKSAKEWYKHFSLIRDHRRHQRNGLTGSSTSIQVCNPIFIGNKN